LRSGLAGKPKPHTNGRKAAFVAAVVGHGLPPLDVYSHEEASGTTDSDFFLPEANAADRRRGGRPAGRGTQQAARALRRRRRHPGQSVRPGRSQLTHLDKRYKGLTHPDKKTVVKVRRVEVKELPPPRPFVPPGPTPGWTQLFNGKDLAGWQGFPRETTGWEVKDGILVGSGPQSNLFSERGDFKNFHLRVEARVNHGSLSALCCRGKYGPGDPVGYVAPINSTGNDSYRTGSLRLHTGGSVSGIERVTDTLVKPEVWFTLEVIARGTQLIVKVNGEETVNSIDQKNSFKVGNVVLERLDRDTVVQFRTIELKELPP
jgi:hypothetical protein